jgi:ribosomal protein S18 acetylase RimI-like enzyme
MSTGQEFTLRRARPEDAPAVAEIHLSSRRHGLPYLPEVHTDAETHGWVAAVMLPHQEVWVAEVAGEVAGYAALHEGWLEHLYIAPAHQGHGLGRALLDLAMARNPGGLQLYAFQRNERARRFYERRGFVAEWFGDGSENEEGEPDVRYRWPGSPA